MSELIKRRRMQRLPVKTKRNARHLRSNMTDAEQSLWQRLRQRQIHGLKFRRQHPCGYFILDFACIEIKLAIEVDGGQHADAAFYDEERSHWLKQQGWTVLRFWNNQVLDELDAVMEEIFRQCIPPS